METEKQNSSSTNVMTANVFMCLPTSCDSTFALRKTSQLASHFQEAFANINKLKAGSLLCDITILFGESQNGVQAHKLILASSSKFFQSVFLDPNLGFTSIIKVQDSDEVVGGLLVEFAYTGHISISEDNVINILQGANKLGFDQVQNLCLEALKTKLDLSKVQGMDLPNLINLINSLSPSVTTNQEDLDREKTAPSTEHPLQQSRPVYVELTPGHIVLMTTTGNIRKIKMKEAHSHTEVLTLKPGVDTNLIDIAVLQCSEEIPETPKMKIKKLMKVNPKSEMTPASSKSATITDFDRKLLLLANFEERLSLESLRSIVAWQREPLKRRKVLCPLCSETVNGTYHDLVDHVWSRHGPKFCSICAPSPPFANDERLQAHFAANHRNQTLFCKICGVYEKEHKKVKCKFKSILGSGDSEADENDKTKSLTETSQTKTSPPESSPTQPTLAHHSTASPDPSVGQVHPRPSTSDPDQADSLTHRPTHPSNAWCDPCQRQFSTKAVYEAHHRAVHLLEKEVPKPCPECGKQYTVRALREHRKRDHQGLRYFCADCPTDARRLFTTKIMLHRHREVVHQKRRYRCTLCFAEFVDRSAWKLHHEAEHVGKRYPCGQCLKQFKRPGDVRRHIKEVHQRCRFTCQYCDRSFSQANKLKQHIKSLHLGDFPHVCRFCGKGCMRPGALKKHIERIHPSSTKTQDEPS